MIGMGRMIYHIKALSGVTRMIFKKGPKVTQVLRKKGLFFSSESIFERSEATFSAILVLRIFKKTQNY